MTGKLRPMAAILVGLLGTFSATAQNSFQSSQGSQAVVPQQWTTNSSQQPQQGYSAPGVQPYAPQPGYPQAQQSLPQGYSAGTGAPGQSGYPQQYQGQQYQGQAQQYQGQQYQPQGQSYQGQQYQPQGQPYQRQGQEQQIRGQAAPGGFGAALPIDQLVQMERQDFGVPPTSQLHPGPMHGPTPSSIPGGQVVTTKGVISLVEGQQTPFLIFDVLGGTELLPNAIAAVPAHRGGDFNDQTQREFGGFLQNVTKGNQEIPLVFYCLSNQCWMSYNASLRAINLGYRNVLWYRGGIEAWKAAGRQVQSNFATFSQ